MNIQGINCRCSKENWIQVLKEAFPASLAHQGHQYIYLNQKGALGSFDTFIQATDQQYNWQLTIDDIIRLSRQCFETYKQTPIEELFTIRHAYTVMKKGAQDTWWSCLIHWFRGLGFKSTQTLLNEEFDKCQQQLSSLTQEKLQSKYQKFEKTRLDFNTTVARLNDDKFKAACQNYLEKYEQEDWQRIGQCPTEFASYEEWHKQEEALANIQLLLKDWNQICEHMILLTEKKIKFEELIQKDQLEPYFNLAQAQELIHTINDYLTDLVYTLFDQLTPHHAQDELSKMDAFSADLEEQQVQLLTAFEEDEDNYESEVIQEVLIPLTPVKPLLPAAASLRNAALCPSSPVKKLLSKVIEKEEVMAAG